MVEPCPKCGHTPVTGEKCPSCGIVVALYRSYLEKMRRGPQRPTSIGSTATASSRAAGASTAVAPEPSTASGAGWRAAGAASARAVPMVGGTSRQPSFHGGGGSLFGIHIVNAFLTLLTFGVYYFWGKVRVRRYLFSQTEIEGDRFAYHGTGRELFNGTMKAGLVFGLPIYLLNWLPELLDAGVAVRVVAGLAVYVIAMIFVPVAIVGARRYRLSRTSWRGVRFSFRGRAAEFIKIFIPGSLMTGLTLGFYYPFWLADQQTYLVSHSYFGNRPFAFDGRRNELFGPFLLAALLTLPTLGLVWFWFIARKRRYFWNGTSFAGARFTCTVTGGKLLGLWAVNIVLLALTLGLGAPWVIARNARFALDNLTLDGPLDLAGIEQDARSAGTTGEGLSSFIDADFDLG